MSNKFLPLQVTYTGFKVISKFPLPSLEIATAFVRSYGIANNIPLALFTIVPLNVLELFSPMNDNTFKYSTDCHSFPDLSIGPLKHKTKSQIRSDEIDSSHPFISGISKNVGIPQSKSVELDFSALNPIQTVANIPMYKTASEEIYSILMGFVLDPDYNKRMNFATTIANPDLATSNRDADLLIFNKIKRAILLQPKDNPMNITIENASRAISLFYSRSIDINKFQSYFPHLTQQLP
jgi:hypothetical protein